MAARTAADGKWVRRIAFTAADGVGASEWLEMGGEKNKMQPTNPNAHTYFNGYAVTQNNFLQKFIRTVLYIHISPVTSLQCGVDSVECGV